MKDIKQVIVMRTKYPDGKGGTTGVRKGKLVAQGSHASMAFITRRLPRPVFSDVEQAWLDSSYAKVCVCVESEEELLDVFKKAKEADLEVHLVTDSGRTEFGGVPTHTCLAIGPDLSERIDKITGNLVLL